MNSIAFLAHKVDDALKPADPSHIIPKVTSLRKHAKNNQDEEEDEDDDDDDDDDDNEQAIIDDNQPSASTLSNSQKSTSLTFVILQIILFIPNLLIIRPLLFIWFIFTFPLSLLEKKKRSHTTKAEAIENSEGFVTNDNDNDNENNNENNDNDNTKKQKTKKSHTLDVPHSNTIIELDEETEKLEPNDSLPQQDQNDIDLKSPTSPSSFNLLSSHSKLLTFPKYVFPRNLVNSNAKKTLILDLDETLVHSLSKGTRMSNGQLVEIKLADQVATLYSVHKRPYCDFFLKNVSKWFDLVIFTASVKEYADPVIDLLETERKYFNQRYYRNHCTLRDGQGYIKDLSKVDRNLHNVIIIDNSPISYALHENNAIMVEGWINDPSDTDLLNLIPLLNSLRYTTDVRSVLSLKNGEAAFER